ncbi:hypothetical protein AAG906_016961 [Vitis piasezkii]
MEMSQRRIFRCPKCVELKLPREGAAFWYAAVFAAFVAGMAYLVGNDFSAELVASLAKSFEDEYLRNEELSLRNLTLLLSYLYIFNVFTSDLIYDLLTILSKQLLEIDVSTILTILQCSGIKLRHDDPVAMKNFILSVQNRMNELKATSEDGKSNINNKRMEFMLETICNIKNNKKSPKEDTLQYAQINKWLQKGSNGVSCLIQKKNGHWWLSSNMAFLADNAEEVAARIEGDVLEVQKMLQLAATLGMNTDARRAIFCIIMTSVDVLDAFQKLLRLDLPGKQDRDIMRVILRCCLREEPFNKYYTILASHLCKHDKNQKYTLQYCLWDHFKRLESMNPMTSLHLARFVAEMLASFTLSLAVLKTVELSDTKQLTPTRIMHFRMIFEAIFKNPDRVVWNIFKRIAVAPELETLRNGIKFFVREYVVSRNKGFAGKFKVAKRALNSVEVLLY